MASAAAAGVSVQITPPPPPPGAGSAPISGVLLALGLALAPSTSHAPPLLTALAPYEIVLDGREELVDVAVTADGTRYASDRQAGLVYQVAPAGAATVWLSGLARSIS
ncbi:MAG: hypothetical protein ACREMB_20985 [Candidatus Rokuibacteriota bacterium]